MSSNFSVIVRGDFKVSYFRRSSPNAPKAFHRVSALHPSVMEIDAFDVIAARYDNTGIYPSERCRKLGRL